MTQKLSIKLGKISIRLRIKMKCRISETELKHFGYRYSTLHVTDKKDSFMQLCAVLWIRNE